jgi:hypothetical protein
MVFAFWLCLILFNMMISTSIHFPANDILLYGWIILHHVYIPHFLYLFINTRIPKLSL